VFLALTVCAATMVPMEYEASRPPGLSNVTGNMMVLRSYSADGAVVVVMKALLRSNVSVEAELALPSSSGNRVTRWPFYPHLCGAMFCLLMSSGCHLLACHSEHAR
jgi:adiponectin receptor